MRPIQNTHTPGLSRLCKFVALALFVVFSCFSAVHAQWTTTGNDISNSNSGNVGVKTTTPEFPLQVNSSGTNVLGAVYTGALSSTSGAGFQMLTTTTPSAANQRLGFFSFGTRNAGTSYNSSVVQSFSTQAWTLGSAQGSYLTFSTTPTGTNAVSERMRIDQNGYVGIGTSSPADLLHISNNATNSVGTIRLQGGNNTAGFIGVWDFVPMLLLSNNRHPGTANNYKTTSAGSLILIGVDSAPGDLGFYTTSTGTTPTYTELVRMKASGRVGIGTGTPGYQLDVQGGSINSSGGLCIAGDCKTAWSQVGATQWTTSGTTINYSTGNVGIGVASPTTKLDVNGTVNATGLTVNGTAVTSSQWATSGTAINYSTGNVGIATASPTEKLDVTGNVKVTGNLTVSGNIAAKYQDVAEWVESSQDLAPGTVVVLDTARSNQVVAAKQAYDSRVAGVISAQPGLVLGEAAQGRVLVATTGRVRVKVDASNGPIQIGDLLVTSDREGVAMKSVPVEIGGVRIHRPGTLIGKALEPLAKGTGEILALLSLQ
ncbi:MAG TPA: hypothetical protein VFZ22_10660 [Pyrinomonadaceae bacterium]|nr:hypothetical protein [Pyrinomonadaceae bacterium]